MLRQLPLPFPLNPAHGFEEFYPGENAEVVNHLRRSAQGSGEPLILLWGEAGLGKTHLLHACCREAHRLGLSVSYMPLRSMREHGALVLDGLEAMHLVCLDDIDSIAGNEDWEYALFKLFNSLRDAGHRMIVSAVSPADALPILLPDLKTRLSWGLTLMLRPLTDADKLAALLLRARMMGMDLPPRVGRFLLNTRRRDLDGLMRLLEQLDRATLAAQHKLTIPFIKAYLKENPCAP